LGIWIIFLVYDLSDIDVEVNVFKRSDLVRSEQSHGSPPLSQDGVMPGVQVVRQAAHQLFFL
jgi:hypothetical protein